MTQRKLTNAELADFLDTARRRKAYFQMAGCRYWAFEQPGEPGAFLEFAEAPNADTLAAALRGPQSEVFSGPVFTELATD
ncbi:MAG: hypothetical protein ACT4R6_02260 [Gemmatimonadaceae bacterium]